MILASDLDRTLFFSERAINEMGSYGEYTLKPIERKDGKWVSYMTEKSFALLKEIAGKWLFIPITTRTTAQFKRFVLFEKDIPLSYAVTSNGASILYNGEPIEEWSDYISTLIRKESVTMEDLLFLLQREGFDFTGQMKQADHLFFYYILDDPPSISIKNTMNEFISKYGWRMSLQGRKLYFIPSAVNKGKALEYICCREGMEAIAGAGDSVLDFDFIRLCRHRFVPKHGELARMYKNSGGLTLTRNHGPLAGEEILQQYITLLT